MIKLVAAGTGRDTGTNNHWRLVLEPGADSLSCLSW